MSGREVFSRYKKHVDFFRKVIPAPFWRGLNYIFKGSETKLGVLVRYIYYSKILKGCGDATFFGSNLVIKNANNILIGENCSVHAFTYMDGAGNVSIGDNVSIAHGCSIVSFEHTWEELNLPIKYNPTVIKPVSIGNDVWIGCGVRILAGSIVNDRVVVAAGAVVKGNLESGYLYGGVPAKQLKKL